MIFLLKEMQRRFGCLLLTSGAEALAASHRGQSSSLAGPSPLDRRLEVSRTKFRVRSTERKLQHLAAVSDGAIVSFPHLRCSAARSSRQRKRRSGSSPTLRYGNYLIN